MTAAPFALICRARRSGFSGVFRMRTVCRWLLVALLSVALTASLAAQTPPAAKAAKDKAPAAKSQAAKGKQPEAGKMFGDWGIACEIQVDKTEKCFASQYQFVTESGQRIVNVHVGYFGPKGEAIVVAFLPLGIDLQAGTSIKFEPGPQVALAIETCVPEGCRASALLDAAAQKAVREAKSINILMLPHGKDQLTTIAISVKGLAPAFASLK
jgi:invasion protein IalB